MSSRTPTKATTKLSACVNDATRDALNAITAPAREKTRITHIEALARSQDNELPLIDADAVRTHAPGTEWVHGSGGTDPATVLETYADPRDWATMIRDESCVRMAVLGPLPRNR